MYLCAYQEKAEIKELIVPMNRLTQFLQLCLWRKQHQKYLIYCEWINIEPFNNHSVKVFMRQIQNLTSLHQLSSVSNKLNFNIISLILQGFKILFQKFGPFFVDQTMIVFNQMSDPLVWMHTDYQKIEYKRDYISEEQFGSNLIELLLQYQTKEIVKEELLFVKDQKYCLQNLIKYLQQCSHKYDLDMIVKSKEDDLMKMEEDKQVPQLMFTKRPVKKKRSGARMNKSMGHQFKAYFQPKPRCQTPKVSSILKQSQQPTESSFPRFSKVSKESNSPNIDEKLDKSFHFQQQQQFIQVPNQSHSITAIKNQLLTSFSFDSDQQQKQTEKQIVALPKLDQFNRCLVDSVDSNQK